jgi:hydrogenase/urease accessory protein HupE
MRATYAIVCMLAAAFSCLSATPAPAHELRPAFLEITQYDTDAYDVMWKVPARGEFRLSLQLALPPSCTEISPATHEETGSAAVSRWRVRCEGGLAGKPVSVEGLSSTYTDVLARIARLDGTVQTARITPDMPFVEVVENPSALATAQAYFLLGVEHILLGIDHLLFVLALLLLIDNTRTLIATITSFTVAHSITLAFAALGLAAAPQPPVEALIALSILFVAAEIIRAHRGYHDLSGRYPWLIAFIFGLLHGFGFGGALREIGLPQKDVPLALLTFNLGVETGQLLFIFAVLAIVAAFRLIVRTRPTWPRIAAAYGIGSVSAFWFVQRLSTFLA